jgi:CheY-like chemotaxis protein
MLSVDDTGDGLDASSQSHLFEPFFVNEGASRSVGLELATVHGIVKRNGGHIAVVSESGRGTRFTLHFPWIAAPPVAIPAVALAALPVADVAMTIPAPAARPVVLLVEDEAMLRRVVVRTLGGAGYEVIEAKDSAAAIELCQAGIVKPDLILTDIVLPGLRGPDLISRLAPSWPNAKVIYTSGYAADIALHRNVIASADSFLGKPFTPSELLEKVRIVLEQDRAA